MNENVVYKDAYGYPILVNPMFKRIYGQVFKNSRKDKDKKRPLYQTNDDIISIYNDRIDLYKKCAHYIIDIRQIDPNTIKRETN